MTRHASPPPLRDIVRHPEFVRGMRDMAGMAVGIGAWGLVTGVAMTKSGMPVPLAIFMSLLVYAGSAQLAVLPLIIAGSPVWVVWLTASCVNLRFVIFSAMWRSYFGHFHRAYRCLLGYVSGDVTFVLFTRRYPDLKHSPEQLPYFWGASTINWVAWQGLSIAGMLFANAIPQRWGLGFAGVLALLGVLCSMLSDRISWVAAGVSGLAAIAAFALPLKLNILVAIAAAVAVGLVMEAAFALHRRMGAS
ncbi:AzlC family ABC transporter permease [Ramlibacter sp. H39-3-26]|uniref:AzlC family ABC transporter permease n=1 Tax=Curvibacter soli TaxID=3031331 RepID=UPI0023DA352C|nr:AzlC family ABC transporter permease [Ramlibacter sp. H39-3-26]MDF1484617.1 AzlC family ABC transporter permease [Ramlibacter sp. H39-3-26]